MDKIYALREPDGPFRYVGKTRDVLKRLKDHRSGFFNHNAALKRWLASSDCIQLLVLEFVVGDWRPREAFWIAKLREEGHLLLNLHPGGGGLSPGQKMLSRSKEHKERLGLALKGRKKTMEHRKKLSLALKGRKCSPGTEAWRKEHSRGLRGQPLTAEHRANVSEGLRHSWAEGTLSLTRGRRKMRPRTAEHRANISVGLRKYWFRRKK